MTWATSSVLSLGSTLAAPTATALPALFSRSKPENGATRPSLNVIRIAGGLDVSTAFGIGFAALGNGCAFAIEVVAAIERARMADAECFMMAVRKQSSTRGPVHHPAATR